jgi:AcrR family transcriptional regulator
VTTRSEAKEDRRAALLSAAAHLFARRGFNGVSIEELGAAVEMSGPALYRYFPSKQAVLAALLVGVSQNLLDGGAAVLAGGVGDRQALGALVRFQVDFATREPDVIRVQDRDLDSLGEKDRRWVRELQLSYLGLWMGVLGRMRPELAPEVVRLRVRAVFGLINSTPHSVRASGRSLEIARARAELEAIAMAALLS